MTMSDIPSFSPTSQVLTPQMLQALSILTGKFTGTVVPQRKRKTIGQKAYEKSFICTTTGKWQSSCRIFIPEPNIEYPQISIFLSFENAKGSCFIRMSLDQLKATIDELSHSISDIDARLPQLQSKSILYEAKQKELDMIRESMMMPHTDTDEVENFNTGS